MQQRLNASDALLLLSLVGICVGVACALSMVLLHWLLHLPALLFMEGNIEGFEDLPILLRVLFPLVACFILVLFMHYLPKKWQKVGVPYVIERLNYHKGNLPLMNGLVQFISAGIALMGGLSIGKEGPAVHVGATFGSRIAMRLGLPQKHVEVLVACGVAGAISAAFQTPLAGVLFALEVIFLEYQIAIILPVILSAVFSMAVSHLLLGPITLFSFDRVAVLVLNADTIMALLFLSLAVALLAGVFFRTQELLWRVNHWPLAWRFMLVGVVTAICAAFVPEVLGAGYDSLERLLAGVELTHILIVVLLTKVLLTAFTIGLGIPGGMTGPTFLMGGLIGVQVALWSFAGEADLEVISLFALLGMSAMMATSFQAPLTGLIAIVEMTHSPEIVLPAMLVIATSCVITRVVFKQDSIFVERLTSLGLHSKARIRVHNDSDIKHK
ncbi:putative Voltage-gated ClC-type chloride channel clcA [Marinomonas sp. MED121]|uniref:chloride channel protein n=1 Tax=Marinomonas sp. MED121 TaxID=314277 RepID=UPI000069107F|nr:chloride channel protein [Marinomonas sp. MED121]EAQ67475.1 putative Voltage-gated ClC-type chloride channel clcA [Marinomonas sp. MED121]